jgi:hypothetical protein
MAGQIPPFSLKSGMHTVIEGESEPTLGLGVFGGYTRHGCGILGERHGW